jgi:acetyltransferase-like isoleucine patch superfamily enzyme
MIFTHLFIMTDLLCTVIGKYRNYRLNLLCFFSTLIMKIEMLLKKIAFGESIKFWGRAYFLRYPGSVITIGNSVAFRSDKYSNLIGVNRKCIIATHSNNAIIFIGNNCGLSGTVLGAKEKILIGNNVLCGANTLITDFDWHGIQPDKRRCSTGDSKQIVIGDNVFIGYGTVILKGVTIGNNSVIGANSVVTKNIPENVIAAGNPCKVIKNL